MPDSRDKRRFRFSLRTLIELTVVCAIAVGWWVNHSEYRRQRDEISLKLRRMEEAFESLQTTGHPTDFRSFIEIDGAKYEVYGFFIRSMFDSDKNLLGQMLVILISGDVVVDWLFEGKVYGHQMNIDAADRLVFVNHNRSVKSMYAITREGFKPVSNK
ncbi:MAG: hypothetical protein IH991_03150 [Planctomycetes bacterium]|nr:hypothetical protein [Planctomycetota bacterium]